MRRRRSNSGSIVWLEHAALATMRREAARKAPHETGGVLVGYWADRGTEVVVTAVIGPGPDAEHEFDSFRPDYGFQEREIVRRYEKSRGSETYLGDWHTHPDASDGQLSRKDRRTLWRIATFKDARAAHPLMAVLHGGDPEWNLTVWLGHAAPALGVVPRVKLIALQVRDYGGEADPDAG